ncbi:hypothetical protein F2P79_008486 [Pimephales promelas]|nr:hypothetical protein F2P79_008486 [Pimephales promelas]
MTDRSVKLAVNSIIQNSWTLSDDDKLRMAIKLPAITKGLVDNRNHRPQLRCCKHTEKKEELLQLTHGKQWINQPIMTQESDPRRDRKMDLSSTKLKPSALIPMKDWEERQQKNMHRQMLMKAKPAVDSKGPETLPLIRGIRTKVQDSTSTKLKPSALLPMKDWEERQQKNMHRQMLMKAKAAVDTKGPETLPHITGNRKKVQLQKERKISLENQQNEQRIRMLESDFRRERWEAEWEQVQQWRDHCRRFPRGETNKQVLKPSALLPMREWEERQQKNMHRQMLMKAKPAVDAKGPETLPLIRGIRTKVQ